MATYHFAAPSLLDEITFVNTEKGGVRGYLHAAGNTPPERLHLMIGELRARGMDAVPFMLEHKPTLEVRGFSSEKELVKELAAMQAVQGNGAVEEIEKDKLSWWETVKKRSLQASGAAYLVGDYGFFRYNLKEADRLGVAGAFSYFLGTLALVGYGRNDQSDLQVHDQSKALEQFLNHSHIKIPQHSALDSTAKEKKKTAIQSFHEFCQRYPSEIFNSVTALAGVFVAASAFKKTVARPHAGMDIKALRKLHLEGWMDIGLGGATATSGVLATLVKEKKPDPDAPPAQGINWLWEKIQEHPLAIAGGGYTIATLCHAASTYTAWKEAKRVNDRMRLESVPGRALFVGMALLAELLLAISSKGHGEGVTSDDSVDKSIYAIAAEVIVKQPPSLREAGILHIAGFLQQPDVLAESADVVEKELRRQVALLDKNPWVKADDGVEAAQQQQPRPTPATPSNTMQPGIIAATQHREAPALPA